MRIALFASRAASNPDIAAKLFLSRRTVEYHLHKVLTKLGVTSMAEPIDGRPAGSMNSKES